MDHSDALRMDLRIGPIDGEAGRDPQRPMKEARTMSIAVGLSLLAAVGYGSSDFVGGAGARRVPTMSIVFIGQLAGAAAMLVVGVTSRGTPTLAPIGWALLAGLGNGAGSLFLLRGLGRGRM